MPMPVINIRRHQGIIVEVGKATVKDLNLPDWSLAYIEYPPGEMLPYRMALQHAHVKLEKVTSQRIYFRER